MGGRPAYLEPTAVPPSAPQGACNLRSLWLNLILHIWREDPLHCPCYKGFMKVAGSLTRPEKIECFLLPHGM